MDIQAIIDQVMQVAGDAPEKIGDILADPKGAIEEICGQTLGEGDLSQIVSGVQERLTSGDFDLSQIDLSKIDLSKIDLSALGGLGNLLGNSPLGGIAEGLGGLFGKK